MATTLPISILGVRFWSPEAAILGLVFPLAVILVAVLAPRPRRRPQFTLRTLLLVAIVAGLALSMRPTTWKWHQTYLPREMSPPAGARRVEDLRGYVWDDTMPWLMPHGPQRDWALVTLAGVVITWSLWPRGAHRGPD